MMYVTFRAVRANRERAVIKIQIYTFIIPAKCANWLSPDFIAFRKDYLNLG